MKEVGCQNPHLANLDLEPRFAYMKSDGSLVSAKILPSRIYLDKHSAQIYQFLSRIGIDVQVDLRFSGEHCEDAFTSCFMHLS